MNLKRAAQRKLKKSGGFTLVEMLIVVAIIAILVVVSIPMVSNSLENARQATDAANMRAAKAAALITYMSDSSKTTFYYDAASGQASGSVPTEGYNQSKKLSDSITNAAKNTYYLEVTITDGVANATWKQKTP